jgi:hypothetical protein
MASRGYLDVSLLPVLMPLFRLLARASLHGHRLHEQPVYGLALREIKQHAYEVTCDLSDEIVISLIKSGSCRGELRTGAPSDREDKRHLQRAGHCRGSNDQRDVFRIEVFLESLRAQSEAGSSERARFFQSAFARAAIIAPLRAKAKKRPVSPTTRKPSGTVAAGDP